MIRKSSLTLAFLASAVTVCAQEMTAPSPAPDPQWLIEPVKISSLMVNTHPRYNGWGFEAGRRLTDKLWITSMIEKTQGSDFANNFDPSHDYLVSFRYFAWLNTLRYYLKPQAVYTTFFDGGLIYQSASHSFLRNQDIQEEDARAVGAVLFVGGEWRFSPSRNIYLKWRSGGFLNLVRTGSFNKRIDDGQNQPAFFMYPHLSDAVIGQGTYAGDVAIGFKF